MTGDQTRARNEVLDRIRNAIARTTMPQVVARTYHGAGDLRLTDPVGLLVERLTDYRASVSRCAEPDVPATIAKLLDARDATDVVVPAGFPATWLPNGLRVAENPPTLAELDTAHGVITTCAVAIAITGTIVLDHGPGQGTRALTLVPDHHLIVVRTDQIVAGVPDGIGRLDPTATQTWISGPSATSDIELNRVEGVHGPRHLQVLIVDECG